MYRYFKNPNTYFGTTFDYMWAFLIIHSCWLMVYSKFVFLMELQ